MSQTADGSQLVTVETTQLSGLFVASAAKPAELREVLPARGTTRGAKWMPDGRVAYVSDQSGAFELWSMNADGSGQRQLTTDGEPKTLADIAIDGKYIYMLCSQGGTHICRVNSAGGPLSAVVSDSQMSRPSISPDGQLLIYSSWINGRNVIRSVNAGGGEPQSVPDTESLFIPAFSPDGKLLAAMYIDYDSAATRIAVLPATGGDRKLYELPKFVAAPLRWTLDGHSITYLIAIGEVSDLYSPVSR